MNREQLEHVIRAASSVLGEDGVIIIGSQAILGTVPNGLPRAVTLSIEVDVMAIEDITGDKALLINGTIGELTRFHTTFGYYAEGVEDGVSRLPHGWRERLVKVETPATNNTTGWCLELHDLCVSKLIANRDRDLSYVRALLRSGHAKPDVLLERAATTEMSAAELARIDEFIASNGRPGRKNKARHAVRRDVQGLTAGGDAAGE